MSGGLSETRTVVAGPEGHQLAPTSVDSDHRDPVRSLSSALSRAGSPEAVARALANRGAAVAGADVASMAVCHDAGRLRVAVPVRRRAITWAELGVDDDTPLGGAVLHRRPVLLSSIEEMAERYPKLPAVPARDYAAIASLPLVAWDETVRGAVAFAWHARQEFEPSQVSLLEMVARYATYFLERLAR